ncbi:hypothetical protein SS50377_20451 [Spironucleus salmonicida]|uniref:Uncharacterized protein n=1 Tax=Spironucleus salmonicida TaxID=348837 RepID=V6LLS4_9EUKA|nr:hypothetical protein SS50377_20451 [Spironucleus salmonicida]|eukprot:EST45602.1 Hypothetical protein SS50377_14452 [Spironucleus salmonicida]
MKNKFFTLQEENEPVRQDKIQLKIKPIIQCISQNSSVSIVDIQHLSAFSNLSQSNSSSDIKWHESEQLEVDEFDIIRLFSSSTE